MLLLEQYFLFGSEFCQHVGAIAENFDEDKFKFKWPVYIIENRAHVGDLMGAIHGLRYTGFIGELYRKFPFPQKPENFKQKPEGYQNQALVRDMISAYARRSHIPIKLHASALEINIGEYRFGRKIFQELIKYVWRGGYPRWQDEIRPDYVEEMKAKIERHQQWLFENMQFE